MSQVFNERRVGSIRIVQKRVAEAFGLPLADMWSDRRAHAIARPRQVAMLLARELTGHSMPRIARCFRKDHTTVMHAVRNVKEMCARDPDFARAVGELRLRLDMETAIVDAVEDAAERRFQHVWERVASKLKEDPVACLRKLEAVFLGDENAPPAGRSSLPITLTSGGPSAGGGPAAKEGS